ncbi:Agamous-like MADS-box protein AGL80 [Rhynchospora pubera]|uniref:Agamous-like MADS-box protein AGL80 n=1 Tax=Rhynchospora pubera TaxID=906938 RepID=A0AAV8DQG5_9POAL|nr:Agamous-like MADS-box protein AGL80 [Rhynchospora pubera]
MRRKKVNLAWVPNEATRVANFNKRKKVLIKEAHELSMLCGVDTCMVIYGPQDPKPEVWASSNKDAFKVFAQFKNMSQLEQCQMKERERLCNFEQENKKLETKLLMHEVIAGHRCLSDLTIDDMNGLMRYMKMWHKAVQKRLNQHALYAMPMAPVEPPNKEKMPVDAQVRSQFNTSDGLGFGCSEEMTTMMELWCVEGALAWDSHVRC